MSDGPERLYVKDAWHSTDLHIYDVTDSPDDGMMNFRFEFTRMSDTRGKLESEVKAYLSYLGHKDGPSTPRLVLGPRRQDLLSSTLDRNLTKKLAELFESYDWAALMQELIPMTIESQRSVAEVATYKNWEFDESSTPYLLQPYIAQSGVTVLFGPGGTGKSTLAIPMVASVLTGKPLIGDFINGDGNVLWVDYETTKDEPFERLAAFFRFLGESEPENDVTYIKPRGRIKDSVSDLRKHIRDIDAKLVVVDSIANARRGEANSSEDTVALFAILGHLDVPVLAIDHMSAEAAKNQDFTKPYGTVFTTNEARMTWGVMANEEASTSESKQLNLKMAKQNRVAAQEARGVRLNYWSYDSGIVKALQVEENAGVWEGTQSLTPKHFVLREMRKQPEREWLVNELSEDTGLTAKQVRTALNGMHMSMEVVKKQVVGKRGNPDGYKLTGEQAS